MEKSEKIIALIGIVFIGYIIITYGSVIFEIIKFIFYMGILLIFLYVLSLFGKSSPAAQQPQSNSISNYNPPPQVCANCGGGGKCHRCYGGGFVGLMFNQRCPACHGTGRCPACGGRGY
ncbi:MAG: hypothetical protein PHU34_02080 [Candidatus Methanoperedens sp.]|nr:hypothetical protein [Candidatus Methanoperedens sp.]